MPFQVNVVRPKRVAPWQVWTMHRGNKKQPWWSRRVEGYADPIRAEEKAMDVIDDSDEMTYVFIRYWPTDGRLPFVVFDSLVGWKVNGDPLPFVRALLTPDTAH